MNLTADADKLFEEGKPWTTAGGEQPDPQEGHCVVKVGADGTAYDTWVTWGTAQRSTLAWTQARLEEARVVLTSEDVRAADVDIAALSGDIDALHGTGG